MSRPVKVYLSGTISLGGTLPDEQIRANLNQFKRVALVLRERGHEVVDPTEMRPPVTSPTWRDWMVVDLKAMLDCDGIVMLPGWEDSPGARLEHHVALALGMSVDHYGRTAS